jgi:hypothetical protein
MTSSHLDVYRNGISDDTMFNAQNHCFDKQFWTAMAALGPGCVKT